MNYSNRRIIPLVIAACVCLASSAHAIGGSHPTGQLELQSRGWPNGLLKLVNAKGRVHGQWVNSNDYFYYRGSAAELKDFLTDYGKVADTPLCVVIHTGEIPIIGPLGKPTTRFDWKLSVKRRGWGPPIDPRRPSDDPGWVATVDVWLGDAITLSELVVPKHVDVRSAGDLEAFIKTHAEGK